ncbi:GHMP family kinase ATP-binding protein [Hydrogenovibrio thermophilus]|uniref:Dehydrogenase n=1 Tax=Hydrogenovibrio thermophilus TaxID=265883 RepID=A0A410H4F3_9GAMM|nr:dehydrogenase [Hydrogenovibrio thermophilus]QAB15781.1 dehydrogenase [Hydrogenovibrio thermophilus]
MKVRSRAPLRLGIAGGGTDVSPYCDEFGGAVLNATIDMYAYCTIIDQCEGKVEFEAQDIGKSFSGIPGMQDIAGDLVLHKAIYNRVMEDFNDGNYLSIKITTYSDAPAGSGLGSSSTLVVAILKAFQELLNLPLGEYDLAHLAYDIERIDCGLSGGKQDQYCAAFGGVNYMEFFSDDRVIVNPLRIKQHTLNELEASTLLFFTGVSRDSANIINDQIHAVEDLQKLEGLHKVKQSAAVMKEFILKSDICRLIEQQTSAWQAKKVTSALISNPLIEKISETVIGAGAKSLKVSGAGGGGFMMIFCDPDNRHHIQNKLRQYEGRFFNFHFTNTGAESWVVNH